MSGDNKAVSRAIQEICNLNFDDGMVYDFSHFNLEFLPLTQLIQESGSSFWGPSEKPEFQCRLISGSAIEWCHLQGR
jgi:hypothetical protein